MHRGCGAPGLPGHHDKALPHLDGFGFNESPPAGLDETGCSPSSCVMAFAQQHTVAGVLGSLVAYLGAGAAHESVFERLLWPQRYYNRLGVVNGIKFALFLPMGGPIHRVAMEALDSFRTKGLYGGMHKGHMLGTCFYPELDLEYRLHHYRGNDLDNKVRNGLWVPVFRSLCSYPPMTVTASKGSDQEKRNFENKPTRRTLQRVHHLSISAAVPPDESESKRRVAELSEDSAGITVLLGIILSELSAIVCAVIITIVADGRHDWFAAYVCLPLLLKLIALAFCVRREPIGPTGTRAGEPSILVEIDDYNYGFPLISGPEGVVRQFFRHWGHPVRLDHFDRGREYACITVVGAFVVYYPIGLLVMLWASHSVQLVWAAYQVFVVMAMHFSRIFGLNGAGRIEEALAYHLAHSRVVHLCNKHSGTFEIRLIGSMDVFGVGEGKKEVQSIVQEHSDSTSVAESNVSDPLLQGSSTEPSGRTSRDDRAPSDAGLQVGSDTTLVSDG